MKCKYCQAETTANNPFCDKCIAESLRGEPIQDRESVGSVENKTLIVLIAFICTRFFFDTIYTSINHLLRNEIISFSNISGVYSGLAILRLLVNVGIVIWLCKETDKQWLKLLAIFWLIYSSLSSLYYIATDFF